MCIYRSCAMVTPGLTRGLAHLALALMPELSLPLSPQKKREKMYGDLQQHLQQQLKDIENNGLFKRERVITTPMDGVVKVNGRDVIIFCANNYLGLSSHPRVMEAAKKTMDSHGYG